VHAVLETIIPTGIIGIMMNVWQLRAKIIRTVVLCITVGCSDMRTHVSEQLLHLHVHVHYFIFGNMSVSP